MKAYRRRARSRDSTTLLVAALFLSLPGVWLPPARAAQRFSTTVGGSWTDSGSWEVAVPADDTLTDLARIRSGATVSLNAARSVGAVMVGTSGQPGPATLQIGADLNIGTLSIWNGVSFYGGDGDSASVTIQAGGTIVTVGGKMSIAPDALGSGSYTIGSGATLTANSGIWIGHNADATLGGAGALVVDGGTLNINSNPLLAVNGDLVVTNGGTVNASSPNVWMHVGYAGGNPRFVLDSGLVTITNQFMVGAHGTGTGAQRAGDLLVHGVFYLGGFNDNPAAGTGTYTQVGGTATLDGYPGLGALTFNGAGKNTGIYNLDGGTLLVGAAGGAGIKMGGGAGQGIFNFNGGTLKAAAANATFMSGLTAANLLGGGGTIDDGGFAITIGQAISGAGALVKMGSGTVTLSSASSSFSGPLTVAQGTVVASGATGGLNPTGGSLGHPLVVRVLQVSSGATLRFSASDVLGNTVTTPSATLLNSGLVENGGVYNTLRDLTLSGGELRANGGVNATWPAYQLKGTVTVTGAAPSQITATGSVNSRTQIHLGNNAAGATTTFAVHDVTGNSNDDLTVSAALQDGRDAGGVAVASGLIKTGAGTMRSTAINTFTGPAIISNGTVVAGYGGNLSNRGLLVPGGAGLTVDPGATVIVASVNALYGYQLGAAWTAPTLNRGVMDAAAAGNVNLGPLILAGGEMRANGPGDGYGTWSLNNDVLVSADSAITAANVNPGGNVLGAGAQRRFTVQAGATLTFSGFLRNGGLNNGTSLGLVKDGEGTLLLNGANVYSGTTTVSGGTLVVNGSISAGPVAVEAAASLAGTGTLRGALALRGTNAPGFAGRGRLTVGSYTQAPGARLLIVLSGSGTNTSLCVSNAAVVEGELAVISTGYTPVSGNTFTVLTAAAISGTFTTTNLPAVAAPQFWTVSYRGTDVVIAVEGDAVVLTGYDLWAQGITNAALRNTLADADGDGFANLDEYAAGTDPNDAASWAKIGLLRTNGIPALVFNRATGAVDIVYHAESAASIFDQAAWIAASSNAFGQGWQGSATVNESVEGAVAHVSLIDGAVPASNRVFRLRIDRP